MIGCKGMSIIFLTLVSFALLFSQAHGVAVMSIDLGSEWMKVAIVSPGVPMEIALNNESKRKTPVVISFRDKDRFFGEEAQIKGLRFPKQTFSYILDLVGKSIDNPVVQLFKKRFPYYNIEADSKRNTIAFRVDENVVYTPEELLAQLLKEAKKYAEKSADQKINEAVLTVPGFFNQAERSALMQAAKLADIKILQLFNDYSAVALNYGIFNAKEINESARYIMFYDMGASSTSATVVSYQNIKTKEKGYVETHPQISILGVGYDRTLGGLEMQVRLRDYLGKEFDSMKKTSKSVFDDPRAMAKLFKEAGRLKNVLSANADHDAQIEGLLDDKDFKLKVARTTFEELCSDLFERVSNPVKTALDTSGVSMDVISNIILVGAGTRVPKVQEKLSAYVKTELSKNINADEAAALGAVYKAADLSKGFKVKKFITKDSVLFPIQIVFDRIAEDSAKQVKKTLFGKMNPYPQKKKITFNKNYQDFSFDVTYGELDHLTAEEITAIGSVNISRVSLKGVAEAFEKHAGEKAEIKGIKTYFAMDENGFLNLINAELVSEKTSVESEEEGAFSKLSSTFGNLFSGSDDKENGDDKEAPKDDEKPVQEEPEQAKENIDSSEETKVKNETEPSNDKGENKTEKAEKDKKVTLITLREPIQVSELRLGPQILSEEDFSASLKKIKALDDFAEEKIRRDTALNKYESYIISARQNLEIDEYREALSETEYDQIKTAVNAAYNWLDEEGFDANAETYETRLTELEDLTKDFYGRVSEHRERPEVLKGMVSLLNGSRSFLENMRNLSASSEIFTKVEIETLEKAINETQEYYDLVVKVTSETKRYEPVVHTVRKIANQMALLDREVKYLFNKAKIWRPKQEPLPSTEKPSDNQTSTKDGEAASKTTESDEKVEKEESEIKEEVKTEAKEPPASEKSDDHTEL
ncbi:hypothetical protein QAD02_022824 [Eretmocerus hayati]|uniref:Uncharacterized protein n=1 Tax=Eretmocerus hayati TaxID=131215 RepID=A0ACC2PZ03_9HYME|nr:hypothetical protein QAD02_022824 [Eretmocerus hayati]